MHVRWPIMTLRGAAGDDIGLLKRMNSDGPIAGNNNGRSLSHANKLMVSTARPPLIPAAIETTFPSSKRDSRTGMLSLARQRRVRVLHEI